MWVRLGAPNCTKVKRERYCGYLSRNRSMAAEALERCPWCNQCGPRQVPGKSCPGRVVSRMAARRKFVGKRGRAIPGIRHADGMRPDDGEMIIAIHGEVFPIDAAFDGLVHRFQKIIAMRLDMETDQDRRPAGRRAVLSARGKCRRLPDWARECARKSRRARRAARI